MGLISFDSPRGGLSISTKFIENGERDKKLRCGAHIEEKLMWFERHLGILTLLSLVLLRYSQRIG